MTQMLSPRKRPKPPTIASSSPNLRSPANGDELRNERVDVVEAMRPLRMAGDLRLLPGRQLGVEVAQRLRRLGLEPADVVGDVGGVAARPASRAVPRPWPQARPPAFRSRDSCAFEENTASGVTQSFGPKLACDRALSQPFRASPPAGADRAPGSSAVPPAHACRFAWSRCRRGRAASAPRGGRRRSAADGWRRRGAAHAG